MRHTRNANELLEVPRDELWAIVRNDLRSRLWMLLLGGLKNNFDVGFCH